MTDIQTWLARDPDPRTQQQLEQLLQENNQTELNDRFRGRLEFGTAGLRGKVGAGPNRMNRLVIQETATGLGQYLLSQHDDATSRGVVIGYDGRPDSQQFAQDTAGVLCALGIKVYLTYQVAATPIVAFGIRHLNTVAGVVVTASHNPPEYNGFKVYWQNGAQIIAPHDQGIAAEIEKATTEPLNVMPLEQAEQQGLLVWLEDDYYQTYRTAINQQPLLTPHANSAGQVIIAYTAMHGVGAQMAEALLNDAGFTQVFSEASQREPDGTFPTVNFPNPEEDGAMDRVIALAKVKGADIACANDPDADRFAVAAKQADGQYTMLTGDQVGALLGDFVLSQSKDKTVLVGNTIVSSRLLSAIAQQHNAEYYQTLTGFKWLTNVAMEKQSQEKPFAFAYEEALGYTIGSTVWDKDGLSALVAFSQLTAQLKAQGLTVWDKLNSLYQEHGVYLNAQRSIALDPNQPPIGDSLRANPPANIGGQNVSAVEDFKLGVRTTKEGQTSEIDLPSSDVLIYHLADQSRVVVRPSGTEPKLKCYYEVIQDVQDGQDVQQAYEHAKQRMADLIATHQSTIA
ncbi:MULTISPECIES: phospho-sugar mutase [unclassified Vibrio]|uniref:Phospho-sugar mutase n=1 Tax=Vibrio sp. HB236076 TaxID=3232307 RepID=A0AB39HLJ0_9VIBR|nr:phospho-sugar mutase [Vibrio sp. HB161653]MDP5252669.1 phospho-sugar mutase [Vibrio sp. HB161653]